MRLNIPLDKVNWVTSIFLISTLVISLTVVPIYVFMNGLDWFQICLFIFFFFATGISITMGYHRLFSHLSFKAKWPVKLFTLLFGAAAFENSALWWCSEHRRHHKHVDQDDDPYDISKGFFHAHIGWLLFKLKPELPLDNVNDLHKDPLVVWQHKYVHWIGVSVGMILPALIGYAYAGKEGALTAFLVSGIFRITFVQQATFFINSLCHMIGKRPYSTNCTARDSWIMAIFTYGEGYHNFHHEFQHDYRNGVKPWQIDPTKWTIWLLSKVGLTFDLRRVPQEKILLAELREAKHQIENGLPSKSQFAALLEDANQNVQQSIIQLEKQLKQITEHCTELNNAIKEKIKISNERMKEWRLELKVAMEHLKVLNQAELGMA